MMFKENAIIILIARLILIKRINSLTALLFFADCDLNVLNDILDNQGYIDDDDESEDSKLFELIIM